MKMALCFLGNACPPRIARRAVLGIAGVAAVLAVAALLDFSFPLPQPGRGAPYALIVLDRAGTPLRAFPDRDAVWRYPVQIDEVSPRYLEALITFEDRSFYWHFGVNPLAVLRAAEQWLVHGHIVSGGSTLTMQVARILDPTPRTVLGKLHQMARAVQLEAHYSKDEILTLYLNYAPMGGVLQGVEAASRGYLGKSARELSYAEAALLTVLPQQPSRLRPDRDAQRARLFRDKVLERMRGRWPPDVIDDAKTEPVIALTVHDPLLAPLLAERLHRAHHSALRVTSTIDASNQHVVEELLLDRVRGLPPHVSIAAMVLDNRDGSVLAYAGSADYSDPERASFVDMVRVPRSPGSALKPFLYGLAMDEGLIDSESLLSDVPQSFDGYAPANFEQSFDGPVSAAEALVQSRNVPAVQVLSALGPNRFAAALEQGGLHLRFPRGATPNLSIILGGAGVTLENMVGSYAALARGGESIEPRLESNEPIVTHRLLSGEAAFIIRDLLANGGVAGETPQGRGGRGVAWKTGTSFGFRDAWSFGVTDRYTVGVWVGRPDATPNPGYFGANVAAPLLLNIFDALPDAYAGERARPPAGVSTTRICWPGGRAAAVTDPALCPLQRTAWVIDGVAPPTLRDPLRQGSQTLVYWVDERTGLRAAPGCASGPIEERRLARWPVLLEAWLDPATRRAATPPDWSAGCRPSFDPATRLLIQGATDGEILQRAAGQGDPTVTLTTRGAQGDMDWLVNGRLLAHAHANAAQHIALHTKGAFDITALDSAGHFDRIHLVVQGPAS
jgi:penicillin-binding protein 1C